MTLELIEKYEVQKSHYYRFFKKVEYTYRHLVGYEWTDSKIYYINVDSICAILKQKDSYGVEYPYIQFSDGRGFVIKRTFEELENDLKCLDIRIIDLCKT